MDQIYIIRYGLFLSENLGSKTEFEKTLPYVMPFADHCGGIEGIEYLIEEGRLEIVPLGFLRGRSIRNSILYSMESENLTKQHI